MVLSVLLALLAAPAQDGPHDPALVLESLDGGLVRRPLADLAPTDLRDSGAVFARFEGLAPLRAAGPEVARTVVSLHGGDRVEGWVRGGDEAHLVLALARDVELELSIEEVASLRVPGRLPGDGSANPVAPEEGDRLYVQRGRGVDQLDGVLLGFSAAGVTFEGRLGERTHPWVEVAGLFVEDLGAGRPPPPPAAVTVEVVGGGRLSGGLRRLDAAGVLLARAGSELHLPAGLVGEVALEDGSYRFLSDLPPDDPGPVTLFGTGDDLGMVYPYRVDRNCLEGPLASGGRVWSRGLGVHAPSRLTWRLGGAWKRLRAQAAIDDSARANRHAGSVVFRILADGVPLWESPLVRGGDAPQPVDLSLEGVDELVLEVDPATEAFVSDRANWLRPILVRR